MHWNLRPYLVQYLAPFADGQAPNAIPVESPYQDAAIEVLLEQMSTMSLRREQMALEWCHSASLHLLRMWEEPWKMVVTNLRQRKVRA